MGRVKIYQVRKHPGIFLIREDSFLERLYFMESVRRKVGRNVCECVRESDRH